MKNRKPTKEEMLIIGFLVDKAHYTDYEWCRNLTVTDMSDGMGSLLLTPEKQTRKDRKFKTQISEAIIEDSDGIVVIFSLYIDQDDYLFELDVWKVNFERVIDLSRIASLLIENKSGISGDFA